MAIFPKLELESIVQENDKTRLSAKKSFISKTEAAVTLVRIKPDASGSFITVTGSSSEDWYLDWEYSAAGLITVEVEITTDGSPTSVTKTLTVISSGDDKLFSTDAELEVHEDDILQWVRNGRSSFLEKHRMAQTRIFSYLDQNRMWKSDGTRFDKDDVYDIEEFREWSKFEALAMIFEGISNDVEDIFSFKAERYRELRDGARSRSTLRLDLDEDGTIDESSEKLNIREGLVIRR
tara:strand:+ start:3625 stop:4332 length:708 start_codon:yes stop_codon:yes gene_type:complete